MAALKEVDRQLAELECAPRKPEEEEYIQACADVATEEQRKLLCEHDYLTCVRGYASYEPRKEETVKAFKSILDWRDKVNYYEYMTKRIDGDADFYQKWPEYIYGHDKYGHPLVSLHVEKISTDALAAMDSDHMLRLQGQKQAFYSAYKKQLSDKLGEQRYKYSLIVDLKGSGMNILYGQKKAVIQKVFSVGADFFPESLWKIYVINAPFVFRTVWAMIKPWIHPITQAKVNMLGSASAAVKKMQEDGLELDAIPTFLGGTCEPAETFDKLIEMIEQNKNHSAINPLSLTPPGAADATAPAASGNAAMDPTEKAAEDMGHLAVV
ncbi:uncharacterized protein MONBRDRAFT_34692 [Monosiga brevicollis MX1]|uniref:CRAL-TRIO domain-containing protein n=1 Tax=Monosiga brevicollis TaxID=81824 RepID=A9VDE1_MONBE|nr:uncharacterized protein MONBRDRAFT_34692 [Monosiga brevicollis MX1]EDQ84455.1 predicted protein [Monosiga brevicollis MX1]|eukprot:XP_001750750.1 hypothetical protein [Monosiga brevicollis MX1]